MPKPIKKEILRALEAYQQRVADILTKQGVKAHIVGDLNAYKKLTPIAIDFGSVQRGAKEFGVKYGKLLRKEGATMIHGKKVAWLAESMKDTRGNVADIINEGVRTGKGTDAIARELRGTLIRDKNYEYKRIARTETGNIQAEAADKRYKEEGVEEVDWLCGQNPCEKCAQYCGKRYKINEAPALLVHPNCTCDKAPVVTRKVRTKIDKKTVDAKTPLTKKAVVSKKILKKPQVPKKETMPTTTKERSMAIKTDRDGITKRLGPHGTDKIDLTPTERMGTDAYKGANFNEINGALRGKTKSTKFAKDATRNIDSALRKSKVPEDIKVFRGMSPKQAKSLEETGECYNAGYTSTTYNPDNAFTFAARGDDRYFNLMQMEVKKGTKGLIWPGGENEIMLERGLKYKCVGIKEIANFSMKSSAKAADKVKKVRIFVMRQV